MRILLIGEYSNVHWTLAQGLRALGHTVTVLSNGDFWKDYPRDLSLTRSPGKLGGVAYMARLYRLLPRLRGYDVVQLINPMFLELRAQRIFPIYRYLRRHNGKVVLCAFGMDHYWVRTCCEQKPLRYSDFNMGAELRSNADALRERLDWLGTAKERLNRLIATDCDAIVAGLYEYWVCYDMAYHDKTSFIPFPIKCHVDPESIPAATPHPVKIFIGINKNRSEYKGTDIMLAAARDVAERHKDSVRLQVAQSVPFAQYVEMMRGSDILLDQLYSYTPAMNALQAMSDGIVCVGGGEEESYELLREGQLRPIVNVQPCYDSVVEALERLVRHPESIPLLKRQSVEYIARHHDHISVARQYERLYRSIGAESSGRSGDGA